MNIIIRNNGEKPIYEQITDQIKNMIIDGSLAPGEALPSIRSLARDLRISVITTKRAYEELENDAFIETVAGKGSFVANKNLEIVREEQLKRIESLLLKAIDIAKSSDIKKLELQNMLAILYEEGL